MFNTVQDLVAFFKQKGVEAFIVEYTSTTANISLRGGIDDMVRLALSTRSPVYIMPHSSGSDCDFIDGKSIVMYESGRNILTQTERDFRSPKKTSHSDMVDEKQLDAFYSSLPAKLRQEITEANRTAQEAYGFPGIIHMVKINTHVSGGWVTQKVNLWESVYRELREPYIKEVSALMEKYILPQKQGQ